MKLVVGLGNPGSKYAQTRHNIGWLVLDRIAHRAGRTGRGRQRDASESIQLRLGGQELVLAKPLTYMNESGIAVRKLLARERVPLADLLGGAGEFALPFGKRFSRLRVGMGERGGGAADDVFSMFAPDERARLPILIDAAADAVEAWVREGTAKASNRWNAFELVAPGAPEGDEAGPGSGEVGGPADPQGIRRTRTGWRRILPGGGHGHGDG